MFRCRVYNYTTKNMKNNRERGFVKNIVIIIIILIVVFLSQQPYFRGYGKDIYNKAESQVALYWSKAGETVTNEINKGKNKVAQNIWEEIKNYFANIFSKSTGTKVQ